MDCDYDPNNLQKELIENTRGRKKRRRKSKFAKMISEPKPPFDPHDKSYQEYIDEYYKFDCEDIIGDIPCKFKYRQVVPNSFGLSIEEILLAKDRELNRWCSLKKAVQYRPENQEKYDQIVYERKGKNLDLKRKILTSLFQPEENEEVNNQQMETENVSNGDSKKSKKKKKNELNIQENREEALNDSQSATTNEKAGISDQQAGNDLTKTKKKKKKSKKIADGTNYESAEEINNTIVNENNDKIQEETTKSKKKRKKTTNLVDGSNCESAGDIKNKIVNGNDDNKIQEETSKPKKKKETKQDIETIFNKNQSQNKSNESSKKSKKRKNKQQAAGLPISKDQVSSEKTNDTNKFSKNRKRKMNANNEEVAFKKQKRFNNKKKSDMDIGISDARLSAYGINAKKFKNKLKYGNKPN